jgi:hypothetical protein
MRIHFYTACEPLTASDSQGGETEQTQQGQKPTKHPKYPMRTSTTG